MKKLLYVSTIFVAVLGISIYVNGNKNLNSNDINNEKYNTLGLLLETEVGSGIYETSSSDTYPTSGYKFNSELSKCENGGELSWDDVNKKVVFLGNVSDKCYIYFDKE